MVLKFKKLTFTLLLSIVVVFSIHAEENAPSHYIFPAFTNGIIKSKTGNQGAKMNYNTVTEEMVFDKNGEVMAFSHPETIDTVIIQNRKFVPVGNVFYEVLSNGPIVLYCQHKCNLIFKNTPATSFLGSSSTTAQNNTYYTILTNSGIYKMKLPDDYDLQDVSVKRIVKNGTMNTFSNKKQFLKIFPEKSVEIEKYIKTNNFDINKVDELVKIMNYCNELYK